MITPTVLIGRVSSVMRVLKYMAMPVPKLRIVCAWCDRYMGMKDGGEGVTHTICPECMAKELEVSE